jgi:hypothetical protein
MNASATPQVARIYLTDYLFFADGTSRYDKAGSVPRSNAQWIQLGAQEVTVPPGATVPLSYTIRVPSVASLTGSYWSVIMVEASGAPGPAARAGLALSTVVRYGVQVVTHLHDSGERKLTIRSGKLAPGANGVGVALQLEIANTGERATKFDVTTEVFDSTGTVRTRAQQSRGLTYPGTSLMHRVELGDLTRGSSYRAVVVLDAGSGNLSGAQYELKP